MFGLHRTGLVRYSAALGLALVLLGNHYYQQTKMYEAVIIGCLNNRGFVFKGDDPMETIGVLCMRTERE